jgi:hypothetical protein
MNEVPEEQDLSFAEVGLINIDRAYRALSDLRDQLRAADEYLLRTHAASRGKTMVERVQVDNRNVQSISVLVQRDGHRMTVTVAHRGAEGMPMIPAGGTMEFEV